MKQIVLWFACLWVHGFVIGQSEPKKMDLYLLIGQSNMAGRGKVDSAKNPEREGIWVIQQDHSWKKAKNPLHYDKPKAVGVGPGMAFAERLREARPSRPIGLIPCAVGGSRIDDWVSGVRHDQTGIYAYDAMLERVKMAKKQGKLKGIIWHQGEGDSSIERSAVYEEKLRTFFSRLRKDLDAQGVPIIIGTLGDFYVEKSPSAARINSIIETFPEKNKNVWSVSAAGLTDLGDKTHFDARSAEELGRRYADQLLKVLSRK
jgi:hypothetical protein